MGVTKSYGGVTKSYTKKLRYDVVFSMGVSQKITVQGSFRWVLG